MSDLKIDHPTRPAARPALQNDANTALFVDATGALLSYGSAPTGIPRVEDFLVRAALADADRSVGVVKFDRRLGAYRGLNVFERRQLVEGIDVSAADLHGMPLRDALRRVFGIIRRYPAIGRGADRHFADLVTGKRRRGLSYEITKLIFRCYRLYRRALAEISLAKAGGSSPPIDIGNGMVLLSNTVMLGSPFAKALASTQKRAFICHDLIPILHPHFAIDSDHARRFAANIDQAMRQKTTTAICTSRTSSAMLADYVHVDASGRARIRRFSLPSILRERAQRLVHSLRSPESEPFVLYCSTIESRKNHMLLARVWQHALEEGVVLPRLICVGKWGWGVDSLSTYLAAHRGLTERITFTGPVSDEELIAYYRHALFGLVPSRVEGWGYGASECLDFGVPVIVSTAPALKEATCDLMPAIDPDDQAGWYNEICRMSADDDYREKLKQKIAARYDPVPVSVSWAEVKAALQ